MISTKRAAPQAPPGASVPIYREALRIEANMPYATATHHAIAGEPRVGGALSSVSEWDAEALVREWRAWPLRRMHVRHWPA